MTITNGTHGLARKIFATAALAGALAFVPAAITPQIAAAESQRNSSHDHGHGYGGRYGSHYGHGHFGSHYGRDNNNGPDHSNRRAADQGHSFDPDRNPNYSSRFQTNICKTRPFYYTCR
ncbi:hypothetical protein [Nocardia donostiensis]|uniref:Uncharacterized protein n=1 Tax=Nocardia donostiensis TaxID=1538463 RepID=A0A1W0B4U1_9NOCA|nr:hypothetical protein [Nocardia donostiensis]ONM46523.1 hypothetical protein B0T46_22320 [Nocardia donostiensis]OQS16700.1 hypothetical protein B0T36_03240 [Nocardia donostiensis]OQS17527.1 hypothetical protein B0T44_24435 [Nocardia donostiensis]